MHKMHKTDKTDKTDKTALCLAYELAIKNAAGSLPPHTVTN